MISIQSIRLSPEPCTENNFIGFDILLCDSIDKQYLDFIATKGHTIILEKLKTPVFIFRNDKSYMKGIIGSHEIRLAIKDIESLNFILEELDLKEVKND